MYLDPSATTALATAITGVVVAVAAVGIILWRKAKKGVSKVLHIDENAHKEVEDDLVINDEAAVSADVDATGNAATGTKTDEETKKDA